MTTAEQIARSRFYVAARVLAIPEGIILIAPDQNVIEFFRHDDENADLNLWTSIITYDWTRFAAPKAQPRPKLSLEDLGL